MPRKAAAEKTEIALDFVGPIKAPTKKTQVYSKKNRATGIATLKVSKSEIKDSKKENEDPNPLPPPKPLSKPKEKKSKEKSVAIKNPQNSDIANLKAYFESVDDFDLEDHSLKAGEYEEYHKMQVKKIVEEKVQSQKNESTGDISENMFTSQLTTTKPTYHADNFSTPPRPPKIMRVGNKLKEQYQMEMDNMILAESLSDNEYSDAKNSDMELETESILDSDMDLETEKELNSELEKELQNYVVYLRSPIQVSQTPITKQLTEKFPLLAQEYSQYRRALPKEETPFSFEDYIQTTSLEGVLLTPRGPKTCK